MNAHTRTFTHTEYLTRTGFSPYDVKTRAISKKASVATTLTTKTSTSILLDHESSPPSSGSQLQIEPRAEHPPIEADILSIHGIVPGSPRMSSSSRALPASLSTHSPLPPCQHYPSTPPQHHPTRPRTSTYPRPSPPTFLYPIAIVPKHLSTTHAPQLHTQPHAHPQAHTLQNTTTTTTTTTTPSSELVTFLAIVLAFIFYTLISCLHAERTTARRARGKPSPYAGSRHARAHSSSSSSSSQHSTNTGGLTQRHSASAQHLSLRSVDTGMDGPGAWYGDAADLAEVEDGAAGAEKSGAGRWVDAGLELMDGTVGGIARWMAEEGREEAVLLPVARGKRE